MVVRWLFGLLLLLPLAASAQSVGSSGPDVNARNVFATQNIQGLVPVASNATTSCTLDTTLGGCNGGQLVHGDCNATITFTAATPVSVAAPQTLPAGCQVTLIQGSGGGTITMAPVAGSNATVSAVAGFTPSTGGINAQIVATVVSNAGGVAAAYKVTGDLGTTTISSLAPTLAGQYNVYGNPVGLSDLANTQMDGVTKSGERVIFPAAFNGKYLVTMRHYLQTGSGYSLGNCGIYQVQIQTDSGGLPSGTVLASAPNNTVPATQCGGSGSSGTTSCTVGGACFANDTLSAPMQITADGTTNYWVVIRNVNSDASNWVSMDYIFNGSAGVNTNWVSNPLWDQGNMAVARNTGGGWALRDGFLNIVDFGIADTSGGSVTTHYGIGYVNDAHSSGFISVNGTNQAGQIFTVSGSGNISFTQLGFATQRTAGSGVVTATLFNLTTPGTVATASTNAVATVATGRACGGSSDAFPSCAQQWGTINMSGTLTAGTQYRLVFSTTAGNNYNFFQEQDGVRAGYFANNQVVFSDGNAQISTNSGSTWSNDGYDGSIGALDGDLTFYFK